MAAPSQAPLCPQQPTWVSTRSLHVERRPDFPLQALRPDSRSILLLGSPGRSRAVFQNAFPWGSGGILLGTFAGEFRARAFAHPGLLNDWQRYCAASYPCLCPSPLPFAQPPHLRKPCPYPNAARALAQAPATASDGREAELRVALAALTHPNSEKAWIVGFQL